ncbi:MAG: MBL fold metallo-hydrolase [Chloroflexi bacterium]|nr:MBL fold metallo-hydrolase [Chloroflexota bacterium]
MRIGHVRVEFLVDGTFWMDGGGAFGLAPRVLWERVCPPDALHRIAMTARCLLVESQGQRILVNTGYGDDLDPLERERMALERPRGGLLAELARLGLEPGDVDLVVNTHLHADHCGGNTRRQGDRWRPTFPRASYCVQRLELADAAFPNERTRATYRGENFRPLEAAGQLRPLWGDTWLTPEVCCQVTPGHTRGHQSVVIESQGQRAVFLSDAAPMAVNMERLAWVAAFDVEPLTSIETKRRLARWAVQRRALLLFEHDVHCAAGYLRLEGDGFAVEPQQV